MSVIAVTAAVVVFAVPQFIDTASKFGHGRFQTYDEKLKTYGRTKN